MYTSYLQGKRILVCIQTIWEEAGHEVVDICDVGYFQWAELKEVKTVELPKSHLEHLWMQQIIASQPSGAVT